MFSPCAKAPPALNAAVRFATEFADEFGHCPEDELRTLALAVAITFFEVVPVAAAAARYPDSGPAAPEPADPANRRSAPS
jgi:hypothetical protein